MGPVGDRGGPRAGGGAGPPWGGWLPSQEAPPCLGVPCSPLTGILAEGWGLDQAGLTSENPMFLAGGGDLTRPD